MPNVTWIADAPWFKERFAEWITSAVLLGLCCSLLLPGDTLEGSAGFGLFVRVGFDENSAAVMFGAVAVMRMTALYVNGRWRRSPYLRMFGAHVGSVVFACLAFSLLHPFLVGARPAISTGVFTYAVLAAADIFSAYRTGIDARIAGP